MIPTRHTGPDISVCIANYNGDPYVLDCLRSVHAQTGDFSFEVLLHDDNSTDGSLLLVQRNFPEVSLLTSSSNVGFCVSNNRLVGASKGRYVLLLNNDAVLRPGSLARLLQFAKADHEEDVLGLPQYTLPDSALMDRGYSTDLFFNPVPLLSDGTHEVGVATGACLWVPRPLWDAIGGFPAWFESVAEDIYLCQAARLLGRRVIVLDEPGFDHWVGRNLGGGKVVASRLSTTVRRRSLSERNKTFVMLLCYPALLLIAVLPLHAMFLVIEAIFLLLSGAGVEKVRRIYASIPASVWHHRSELSALRAHLKQRRRCTTGRFLSRTRWFPHKLKMLVRYGRPELR